ncbi:hypothetical protein HK103_004962 [Boothiomyces macroporosus]|uniref:Amine oxidase domain-containing protein n=1 Tax=Boothiomyces macroporosus TaxID=261099 RepID=A0AAD5UGK2_9FUNG|nr:hypothetical protein HK103_004962 [Boothiomyces macroporosus]
MGNYKITVLEKNDFSGGRLSIINKDGYRFDQGPSLYLMPWVFEQAWLDLGLGKAEKDLDLLKCATNYRVYFEDDDSVKLSTDMSQVKQELERIEPGSFPNFLKWLSQSGNHYHISCARVLSRPLQSIFELVNLTDLLSLSKLHLHENLYNWTSKFFRNEKLIQMLTFQSMYMGMSPCDAPATYSLLAYSEFTEGIYYPKGGFHKVVEKLERFAKDNNVEFRYNSPVKQILKSGTKATGVLLETGEQIEADVILCNADLVYSYNALTDDAEMQAKLAKYEHTCSVIVFYWGLDIKLPNVDAHTIYLAGDYKQSFEDIFKGHTLPKIPSFYVHCPSKMDESAAPPNCEALMILVPVGHPNEFSDKEISELKRRARSFVLQRMSKNIGIDLAKHIVSETVNDPITWNQKFNLPFGSALGLAHGISQVTIFRPKMKDPKTDNLYFVGASTNPGTGVPIVMLGAKLASNMINDDLQGVKKEILAAAIFSFTFRMIRFIIFFSLGFFIFKWYHSLSMKSSQEL